jgi:ribonuclease III
VLGFVLARALYDRYPDFTEGQLSKIRAHVVSRRSCAIVAAELGLDQRLEESGDIPDDLRRSTNVLAALMEAVLAGLYLERGLDEISPAVVASFESRIEEALHEPVDHKTTLQEELAKRGQRVEYVTLTTDGPPHDRTFTCAALVDGQQVGSGMGRTKKDAEQEAALEALEGLGFLSA